VSSLEEIEQLAAAVPGSLHAEVTLTVTARSADVTPIDSRRRTRGGLAIGSTSLQKALTRLIAAPGLRLVGVQTGLGDSAMDVESLACSCRDTLHCLSAIRDETGIELSEIAIRGGGGRCAGAGEETLRPPVSWIGLYELASVHRRRVRRAGAARASRDG
jgi:diaminopimelate decarboxylase